MIKPGRILRRAGKSRTFKNFLNKPSVSMVAKRFGKDLPAAASGLRSRVKAAPSGLGAAIQGISQKIGQPDGPLNINKIVQQNITQQLGKRGQGDAGFTMPKLDGLLNSFSKMGDFMKSIASPNMLQGFSNGFDRIKESLKETADLVGQVREQMAKMVKDGGGKKGGGGGLGLGGLLAGLAGGAMLMGGGPAAAAAPMAAGIGKMIGGAGGIGPKLLKGAKVAGVATGAAALATAGGVALAKGAEAKPVTPEGTDSARFNATVDKFSKLLDKSGPPPPPTEGDGTTHEPQEGIIAKSKTRDGEGELHQKAAIQTIREAEGTADDQGYSKWFGDARGEAKYGDITNMTIDEVHDLQTKFLKDPQSNFTDLSGKTNKSAAVGAGQFIHLKDKAKSMGVDTSKQKFTPDFQDKLIIQYAKDVGVDLSKKLTEDDMKKMGGVWASLTPQYNQTTRTAAQSMQIYQKNLKQIKLSAPPTPQAPKEVSAAPTEDQGERIAQLPGQTEEGTQQQNAPQIVPINLGAGGGSQMDPSNVPSPDRNGNNVDFLIAQNQANDYEMYSRVVMNIVG